MTKKQADKLMNALEKISMILVIIALILLVIGIKV